MTKGHNWSVVNTSLFNLCFGERNSVVCLMPRIATGAGPPIAVSCRASGRGAGQCETQGSSGGTGGNALVRHEGNSR